MWTKADLIQQAFSEIGLSSYSFNTAPEDFDTALRTLDSMMATWDSRGFRLGYALPSSPAESNVADESGLPDTAHEAVYLNLAIRIAPSFGKMVSPDTRSAAKQAYDAMLATFTFPPEQASRSMVSGAGNRHRYGSGRTFIPASTDGLNIGPDADFQL